MRLVPRASLTPQPWKNGGGTTREIAAWPSGTGWDDFVWRLSMAEVAADGPFSAFGGIDRTLTLLEGAGIDLDFGGGTVALRPGAAPLAFPGEAPVAGRLPGGPIEDFNVMTRRGAARHAVLACAAPGPLPSGAAAVLCRSGAVRIGPHALGPGDCLLAEGAPLPPAEGHAELLVVLIERMDGGRAADDDPARI